MESLSALFDALPQDAWRFTHPFSADLERCHLVLFDPARTRQEKADALNTWIAADLPCLFARIAAKRNRLYYCILTEVDLRKGDEHVRQTIQRDRINWKREALLGDKHAFVVLAASEKLARAEPSLPLRRFAERLCHLYFSRSALNTILRDELFLRTDRSGSASFLKWDVGINFHAASGDGRWWHDHRIPGGIGFSMNSVGHMSRQLLEEALRKKPDIAERVPAEQLATWALPLAMDTILAFSMGERPGTRLAKLSELPTPEDRDRERCSRLAAKLTPFSCDRYKGWYHTDQTIPAEFFDPRADRPPDLAEQDLQFSYLHRSGHEEYRTMALGDGAVAQEILAALGIEDMLGTNDEKGRVQ